LWVQQAVRSKRFELRKVAGEVNPADLFTKHSLTRERLMDLAKIFQLEFRGGRAASAPQMRDAAGIKPTLAEAMHVDETESKVIIPHNIYSKEELDRLYPPIEAVDEEEENEIHSDPTLEHGMKIAGEIVAQASHVGRRRVYGGERSGTVNMVKVSTVYPYKPYCHCGIDSSGNVPFFDRSGEALAASRQTAKIVAVDALYSYSPSMRGGTSPYGLSSSIPSK
jgi:hypothetical protein